MWSIVPRARTSPWLASQQAWNFVLGHLQWQPLSFSLHRCASGCACEKERTQNHGTRKSLFHPASWSAWAVDRKALILAWATLQTRYCGVHGATQRRFHFDPSSCQLRSSWKAGAYHGSLLRTRLLNSRPIPGCSFLHLWGLSGAIHPVWQLAASYKPLHWWANQGRLPEQPHPVPTICLRESLLPRVPLQFHRNQIAWVGGKAAGRSRSRSGWRLSPRDEDRLPVPRLLLARLPTVLPWRTKRNCGAVWQKGRVGRKVW